MEQMRHTTDTKPNQINQNLNNHTLQNNALNLGTALNLCDLFMDRI